MPDFESDGSPGPTSRSQWAARLFLAAVFVGLAGWTIRQFLPALAWATIIAVAIWPLYRRARRHFPIDRRNIAIPAMFAFGFALLFIVPLGLAAVQVGREAHNAIAWVHEARTTGLPVPEWVERLPIGGSQVTAWWQANLSDPRASERLLANFDRTRVLSASERITLLVLHRSILFLFTVATLFLLLRHGEELTDRCLIASRQTLGPQGEKVGRQIIASIRGTTDGLILVGLGEGVLLGIAYAAAGVPHPALFGAITAVAAMIPMGAPIVLTLATFLLLIKGSVIAGVLLFVFSWIVVFIADHAIRPVLIGGTTRLPFLWVLLGILGGIETWGLLGLFLGPALMAALILLWREWTDPREGASRPI